MNAADLTAVPDSVLPLGVCLLAVTTNGRVTSHHLQVTMRDNTEVVVDLPPAALATLLAGSMVTVARPGQTPAADEGTVRAVWES